VFGSPVSARGVAPSAAAAKRLTAMLMERIAEQVAVARRIVG
jgi:hypothetical protein